MKASIKKFLALCLVVVISVCCFCSCGNTSSGTSENSESEVEITVPTCWIGVHEYAGWYSERLKAFNEQYAGKIKVKTEEIAGDQAYVDKMKVLYSSDSLPSVICTGGYNLIDDMKDKLVDLTPYITDEMKNAIDPICWNTNSRDGKIYGIPYSKQVIGYFYNKDMFAKAGIANPPQTWDEFFEDCDKLKAAGFTPLSMDTADSGWCTSLLLGAMIAGDDEGEKFMNTLQPDSYNTEEFISAAEKIQKLFQNYTTSDAVGGDYQAAASNFFNEETAMICNGPWMVGDFYNTSLVADKFADKIGTAAYPGNVMYNSGLIGYHIAAKSDKEIQAALTYISFMTSEESQKLMLEDTGVVPSNVNVTSDKVYPLVEECMENAKKAERNINDFQSLWKAKVVDEISVQYPLLAQGKITPEEFAQALTDAAK